MGLRGRQPAFANYFSEMWMNTELQSKCGTTQILNERPEASAESGWYAIRVRARAEKLVATSLREKGYDEFLPLYRKRSRWSDRVKETEFPLFPGYVFCHGDLVGKPSLIQTPGVVGILSFGGKPAVVSSREIEFIKRIIEFGADAEPWPFLREGQRVRIQQGALAGVEGIIVRAKSDWRLVLSVEALCRSVAVEIYSEWVTPIEADPVLVRAS